MAKMATWNLQSLDFENILDLESCASLAKFDSNINLRPRNKSSWHFGNTYANGILMS